MGTLDEIWSGKSSGPAYTNTGSATAASAITYQSVLETMAKIREMMPREPTQEQRDWARDNGFPGWPGFKLGVRAYEELMRRCAAPAWMPETAAPMLGIPIVVDAKLPPDAVRSAETEYWRAIYAN